jgi:squalene cyclase
MSPLTPEQRRENAIVSGRAIVKIVEGADYLYPHSRRVERLILKIVRWLYRNRLREIIATVPADIGAEILAASDNITGPVSDISLN